MKYVLTGAGLVFVFLLWCCLRVASRDDDLNGRG